MTYPKLTTRNVLKQLFAMLFLLGLTGCSALVNHCEQDRTPCMATGMWEDDPFPQTREVGAHNEFYQQQRPVHLRTNFIENIGN